MSLRSFWGGILSLFGLVDLSRFEEELVGRLLVTKETSERAWIRSWPRDVPRSIQYPKFSLTRFLTDAASMHPEKTALLYTKDRITFHQLHSLAQKFGKALQDRGVRKGDRVAIYLPNVPDFIVSYYGALSLGAIVVAISPIYKENEILQILTDSKAKVLVSLDKLKSQVDNVRDQTGLELVINCSLNESLTEIAPTSREEAVADKVSMKTLLSNTVGFAGQVVIESEKDLALLQYTGGTTGAPKGAMLTHHNLVANAIQFANWLGLKTAAETHLAALPFFHIYGMTVALNVPIYTASGIVLIPDARDTDVRRPNQPTRHTRAQAQFDSRMRLRRLTTSNPSAKTVRGVNWGKTC